MYVIPRETIKFMFFPKKPFWLNKCRKFTKKYYELFYPSYLIISKYPLVHGSHLEKGYLPVPNDLVDIKSKLHASWHKALCWSLLMQ